MPGAIAALRRDQRRSAYYDDVINKALGGSDEMHGFTNQGMPNDPHGHLRRPGFLYMHKGGNDFTDWEGGAGGRAGARRYREMIESHVNAEIEARAGRGARLADHIRHHGSLLKQGQKVGMVDSSSVRVAGNASLTVDLNAFPRGTETRGES